jgi:hypothetical protein
VNDLLSAESADHNRGTTVISDAHAAFEERSSREALPASGWRRRWPWLRMSTT